MCECLEDLKPYIDERILSNYTKLKQVKGYCSKNDEYAKKYDYLYNKLENEDKNVLEDICGLLDEINAKINYITYETGFIDGIQLNNYIQKNKN